MNIKLFRVLQKLEGEPGLPITFQERDLCEGKQLVIVHGSHKWPLIHSFHKCQRVSSVLAFPMKVERAILLL